jgi:predicted ATPase
MIDRIAGNQPLPQNVRQDIIERTDGIPLFVEEMTKAVIEASGEQPAERVVSSVPSPSVAVPASLHASLMARLDRLGSAKELAQIGATIGREFSHSLIAAMVGKPEKALQSDLNRLIAAGLLFRQGRPPHATTSSNTHWCRMPPTGRCYASLGARFMLASLKYLRTNSPK